MVYSDLFSRASVPAVISSYHQHKRPVLDFSSIIFTTGAACSHVRLLERKVRYGPRRNNPDNQSRRSRISRETGRSSSGSGRPASLVFTFETLPLRVSASHVRVLLTGVHTVHVSMGHKVHAGEVAAGVRQRASLLVLGGDGVGGIDACARSTQCANPPPQYWFHRRSRGCRSRPAVSSAAVEPVKR